MPYVTSSSTLKKEIFEGSGRTNAYQVTFFVVDFVLTILIADEKQKNEMLIKHIYGIFC